jgi:hypothetical protein
MFTERASQSQASHTTVHCKLGSKLENFEATGEGELHLHPFTMQRQGAYNVLDLVLMVSCQGIESLNMLAIVGKASCRLSTLSILKNFIQAGLHKSRCPPGGQVK